MLRVCVDQMACRKLPAAKWKSALKGGVRKIYRAVVASAPGKCGLRPSLGATESCRFETTSRDMVGPEAQNLSSAIWPTGYICYS